MDWVDFVVFAAALGISAFIGIYFAWKDRRNASVDNYFLAGRAMNPITVGMSMLVTYASAVGIISEPAECYITGNAYLWNSIMRFVAAIPSIVYFIPAFRRLNIRSKYEFLEMRFNRYLRRIASIFGIVSSLFYTGLIIYVTSATVSAVTTISNNWGIAIMTVLCIFYTSLGGMKAVIWTDAVQLFFMFAGILAIFITGISTIGGFDNLFSALERGERYTMFRFDYGLIARVSPLAMILGSFGHYFQTTSLAQPMIQRYQSCRTTSQARWASAFSMVGGSLLSFGLAGIGLVIFAIFESCDPVFSGRIQSIDQVVPFTAAYLLGNTPGLMGLYIATIFSAALSTISSLMNAVAVLVVEDILSPFWKRLNKSENLKVFVGKMAVVILGLIIMGIAYFATNSRSNISQLLSSFTGIMTGPLAGLYVLGFFVPKANSKGGTAAFIISLAFGLFLFIGNEFLKVPYQMNVPPRFTYGCSKDVNTTTDVQTISYYDDTTIPNYAGRTALQDLFNLNFNTFVFIGMLTTIILGYLLSLVTGPADATKCDPKLFIPVVDNECLPTSVRTFFRFGVPEEDKWENKPGIITIMHEDKL